MMQNLGMLEFWFAPGRSKCYHTRWQEEETRALVKSNGGLEPLVELIKDHSNHENKELMAAVTGLYV